MRKIYLFIISMFFILTGCVQPQTRTVVEPESELDKSYRELTSGEKTMKKAFMLYELYGGSTLDSKFYTSDKNWCYDSYVGISRDFRYRFCKVADYSPGDLRSEDRVSIVQKFDKDTTLTDKDRYCMESKCSWEGHGGFLPQSYLHNEDECILIRRHLLNDTDLNKQCVFNYKDYIPKYAKIGSFKNFLQLYTAYKESVDACEKKKEAFEITTEEYNSCIVSVEERFEKIVKSGVLK